MTLHAHRKLKPAEPKQTSFYDLRRQEPFSRRTFMPVHRDSRFAGTFENAWFRPMPSAERRGLVHAAIAYNQAFKVPGERYGPLGANGPAVLNALLEFMDRTTGWLDPAQATIAATLRIKRATVISTLAKLRAHGFAAWIRRIVQAGGQGVRGPQVEQTTNAYRLSVPDKAKRLLPWRFKARATPACEAAHHRERAAATEAMRTDERVNPTAAVFAEAIAARKARDAARSAGLSASPMKASESP